MVNYYWNWEMALFQEEVWKFCRVWCNSLKLKNNIHQLTIAKNRHSGLALKLAKFPQIGGVAGRLLNTVLFSSILKFFWLTCRIQSVLICKNFSILVITVLDFQSHFSQTVYFRNSKYFSIFLDISQKL
jgi:hypothetical protein